MEGGGEAAAAAFGQRENDFIFGFLRQLMMMLLMKTRLSHLKKKKIRLLGTKLFLFPPSLLLFPSEVVVGPLQQYHHHPVPPQTANGCFCSSGRVVGLGSPSKQQQILTKTELIALCVSLCNFSRKFTSTRFVSSENEGRVEREKGSHASIKILKLHFGELEEEEQKVEEAKSVRVCYTGVAKKWIGLHGQTCFRGRRLYTIHFRAFR